MQQTVGILGFGSCVPQKVRANDDPVFSEIRGFGRYREFSEKDLFQGFQERRYLDADEAVEDLMVRAGAVALSDAGIKASDLDRLYGYASPGRYISPNGIFEVHQRLGLRRDMQVIPVHSEFTNFIMGLQLAQEAILAGKIRLAMVNCGSAWTRNVNFSYPHALGIADGAGAVIVGPSSSFVILDSVCETLSDYFDGMTLARRPGSERLDPTFEINDKGVETFVENGMSAPAKLALKLLERNGIRPDQISLITHQASSTLLEYWRDKIRPKAYLETLRTYGNMTLATVPVNFAEFSRRIETEYVLLIQLGLGSHFCAMLLRT